MRGGLVLGPWAENESIWTNFMQLNKIERTSLMGVAQEKYLHKLDEFRRLSEKGMKGYNTLLSLFELKHSGQFVSLNTYHGIQLYP